jgi:tetratricopeptide (TPR) repeat protein
MKILKSLNLLVVALSFASCSHSVMEGKAPTALLLALEKVKLITGDDDTRNQLTMKLSRQAASGTAYQEAIQAAEQMSGAKRGATFAMVAWDAASHGYKDQAKEAIRFAERDHWVSTDAEAGLKYAYTAGTYERLGMHQESKNYIHKILDPMMHHLANSLSATAMIAEKCEFQKFKKEDFTPDTVSEAVKGLIPVLEDSKLGTAKKRELLGLLQEMIQLSDPPSKVECWSRIAMVCGDQGLVGDAAILARQALGLAQGFDPKLEMYAVGLSQASMAFSAANEKAEAIHCLELAAVCPQLVAYFFQPEALCAIAKGYQKAGEPEKANQYWLKAIQIAKSHPHPRARQINVVLLLSSMADVGVTPSPEITAVIDAIGRGEGGDAPLPPGYVKVGDTKTNTVTPPVKQDKKDKNKKESKVPAA